MGKIKVTEGVWTDASINHEHLVTNHLINPTAGFADFIMYTEKRPLMTLLVSGVTSGKYTAPRTFGKDTAQTKIGMIPEGELVDGIAWQYRIMGRIQKASEIVGTSAVGTVTTGSTSQGGFFSLALKDNYLNPGMNVTFYNGKQARVWAKPTGAPGNYIYKFQCYPGDTFSWTTWVAPQSGTKTCFGAYSTYGQRSLRGYGNTHYPDTFINHMTTQRKGLNISGDANTQKIYWYEAETERGSVKGFVWEAEMQARAQFNLEDDFQKKWGHSTMKDSYGNLLSTPSMTDGETGEPIYAGDGVYIQIEGANDMTASGVNGAATYDDFADMLVNIIKHTNTTEGKVIYAITGTDGMRNAHNEIATYGKNTYNITHFLDQKEEIGGASPAIGFNFTTMNVAGHQVIFVLDPMMDDLQKFSRTLSDGRSAMSMTYYFLDISPDETGKRNIEIRARGREGVNRNFVYFLENGMTGEGTPVSSVDAKQIQMLKQNLIVAYKTNTCGILSPSTTA